MKPAVSSAVSWRPEGLCLDATLGILKAMGPRQVFYNSQMTVPLSLPHPLPETDERPLKRCIIITLDSCFHRRPGCDLHRKCGRSDSSTARQAQNRQRFIAPHSRDPTTE